MGTWKLGELSHAHGTATKWWLNLDLKFRIFCWFEKCHEVRDTHAPIFLDSWQLIFGCVFVSSYQRWSWAIFLLAASFLHSDNVLHRGVLLVSEELASGAGGGVQRLMYDMQRQGGEQQ